MQVAARIELPCARTFVQALADGARPTRAARTAGYSLADAKALMSRPEIRAALLAGASNAKAVLSELEASQ